MSLVDIIYQAIRQQTNKIGQPVRNIHGAVPGQSPAILNQQSAQWLVLAAPASGLPSLAQFYSLYASATSKTYTVLQATDGVVGLTGNYSTGSSPTAVLFRGVVDLPGPTVIPLGVVANGPSNEFAIYVDSVLQRSGNNSINQALAVSGGRHLIEVLAVATEIYVAVPSTLRVFYDLDNLTAPVWLSLTTGYLDPVQGTVANTLSWYNDTRVGGWIVYRRQLTYLDVISAMSSINKTGVYSVEINGDFSGQVTVGDELASGNETIGTVLSASYDSTTAVTTVNLQLPVTLVDTNSAWLNRTAAVGRFVEQTRFNRVSAVGLITWTDTNVAIGQNYEYVIQAYGMFDVVQTSPMSLIQEVTAGDSSAPSSITFQSGYPQVFDDVVTVKFTTPTDFDYDGVQVQYYDNPIASTSTGSNTSSTLNDTSLSMVTSQYAGYYLFIKSGTGAGQTVLIASHTATQFTLDPSTPWTTTPDATSTYDVFRIINVVTDYGVANTADQLTFNIVGEGTYYFPTFDRGSNIQGRDVAASWVFDSTDVLTIPVTNANITNIGQNGQRNNSILGVTLFSIPKQEELFLETFTGPEGYQLTNTLLTSGTSAASGNSTTTLTKTAAGWTVNAYAGKQLRIVSTSGVLSGLTATIQSNTSTVLTFTPALPIAPDSVAFEVHYNFPNIIAASVLNTTRDRWNTNASRGIVTGDALWYNAAAAAEYTIYLDSAYTGRNVPIRLESVLSRGTTHASGGAITYRGNSTNTNRWEYGIVHSSDIVVIPRYRYNSGGKGTWTNLPGVNWTRYTQNKLVVELDGDTHTFKFADAYGHNEVVLGRITGTAGPNDSCIGWNIRGESGGDSIDTIKMLDYGKLVRIKYRLLPDDNNLRITQYQGAVSSGSTVQLNDTSKNWYTDELVGMKVLITSGPGAGSDTLIKSNTATQLIPYTPFSAALTSSSRYIVYEDDYTGTESLQFWDSRDPSNAQTLEFHGERSGVPSEAVKRVLVDTNQVPEIVMTAVKTATVGTASEITVSIVPDDDVKSWSLYAKKSAWPTLDNTNNGPIDPQYIRWQTLPISVASKTLQMSDGTWYLIGIPYDSNGSPGPYATLQLDVSSGGAVSTFLSNVRASRVGTTNTIRVSWNHTSDIETPTTTHSITITVTNTLNGSSYTLVSGLRPWSEGGGASTTALAGYYDEPNWTIGTKNIDPYVYLQFTVKLILDSTSAVIGTYNAAYSFYGSYNA